MKKNIDKIVKSFDHNDYNGEPYDISERRKHLREKIDDDIKEIYKKLYKNQETPENFPEFLKFLEYIQEDMLNVTILFKFFEI